MSWSTSSNDAEIFFAFEKLLAILSDHSMGSFHFFSGSEKKKRPHTVSIWVASRAMVAEGCVCISVCVLEGGGGSAAGFVYRRTLQLQHYSQGEGWDIIDHVKNGSKFVNEGAGWGAFSLCCHKGSLIVMFMHVNVSQNTL